MKKISKMTTEELVERFTAIALKQDEAVRSYDSAKFNRLFDQMDRVREELRSREGDQRRALLPLYDHPNPQVRLKAAVTTLALAPTAARRVLKALSYPKDKPQALDAGMTLWGLDSGEFKPT
jgi:hypothetical protein